jgi:Mor family transcriptional regulator
MNQEVPQSKDRRNEEIWCANRLQGIGTEALARRYGLSRQRIKQIIARADQKHSDRGEPR